LGHNKGVVGNYQIGPSSPAHGALDETFVVMGTGGIDTFSAPVGEA
jgi:hypothetical protein